MKNKIEIQILSPATRQQLIEIRDEIRKLEGLENFNLQVPPAPLRQDTMGGIEEVIFHGLIAGVTHLMAEKGLHALAKVPGILKKVLGHSKTQSGQEAMSGSKASRSNEWEAVITEEGDGVRDTTYMNSSGETKTLTNREYSINPEKTFAVLIGVSEYDDKANFSSIPPVAGNLDEMYRVLSDKRMVGLSPDNIVRLHNETSVNIKTAVDKLSKTEGIETFIVYYAGHGQNTNNNQLSLIAKDTRNIDEELHSDIPYAFIERTLKNSAAAQKIVLLDACHSGLAAQGNNPSFDIEPVYGTFTLASTSAEDVSFYKRDAENTYFTSYLLDVFNKGIKNINSMLSLADLYQYTSQQLSKAALPAPQYKADLKNVTPDKFFISNNPGFSIEARLKRPGELYQQGNYGEAKKDYLRLRKEYPDNRQLQDEYESFERNMLFNQTVKEGDSLSLIQKNYPAAISKYREALEIKSDEGIQSKILECMQLMKNVSGDKPAVETKKKTVDIPLQPMEKVLPPIIKSKPNNIKRRTYMVFGLGAMGVILVILAVVYWPRNSSYNSNNSFSGSDTVAIVASEPKSTTETDSLDFLKAKQFYTDKDYNKAITYITPLANRGYAKAQNVLGNMYSDGKGLVIDYAKAMDWYQKAAAQDFAAAQTNIGKMYEAGLGIPKDYGKAFDWYNKSAGQGSPSGEKCLADMYFYGYGIQRDYSTAITWYQKAVDQNYPPALDKMGYIYYNGYGGVQKDQAKAVAFYQKAADLGFAGSQYSLGYAYEHGEGVAKNISTAMQWYQKAADQDNSNGMAALKRLNGK